MDNVVRGANPLAQTIVRLRPDMIGVAVFSCAINILMLTGPMFMLQVYDRVLVSRSVPTLVALFGLVIGLYGLLGLFDLVRGTVLSRAGHRIDIELMKLAFRRWISDGNFERNAHNHAPGDLTIVRQFLCGNCVPAFFDLPWVPVYLAVLFALHPWIGILATLGAFFVLVAAAYNEWSTSRAIGDATYWDAQENRFRENARGNADAILAMGMTENAAMRWRGLRCRGIAAAQAAAGRSRMVSALTRSSRMLLQSGILALGAYLAILGEITPGVMIAASILAGRALAPIDQAIANWRGFVQARHAYRRLTAVFDGHGSLPAPVRLPDPVGRVDVAKMWKFPPNARTGEAKPLLQAVDFSLRPGDGLGVIGPSAAGKSTLARLLTGVWMPDRGSVRLDGATLDQWDRQLLGRHIGYLPQSVELMAGSIADNISRFCADISDDQVVAAAKLAGVHELVTSLPDGYSTRLHEGFVLSGGQIQRIALARAVLNNPFLVVLDEPNSNLDAEGDAALMRAINCLREAGAIVVVVAHRPSAMAAVNKLLILNNGRQVEFGNREEVLPRATQSARATQPAVPGMEAAQ